MLSHFAAASWTVHTSNCSCHSTNQRIMWWALNMAGMSCWRMAGMSCGGMGGTAKSWWLMVTRLYMTCSCGMFGSRGHMMPNSALSFWLITTACIICSPVRMTSISSNATNSRGCCICCSRWASLMLNNSSSFCVPCMMGSCCRVGCCCGRVGGCSRMGGCCGRVGGCSRMGGCCCWVSNSMWMSSHARSS